MVVSVLSQTQNPKYLTSQPGSYTQLNVNHLNRGPVQAQCVFNQGPIHTFCSGGWVAVDTLDKRAVEGIMLY